MLIQYFMQTVFGKPQFSHTEYNVILSILVWTLYGIYKFISGYEGFVNSMLVDFGVKLGIITLHVFVPVWWIPGVSWEFL